MSESFQSSVCVPLLAGLLVALLSFGSVPAHAQVDSWGVTAGVTSMTGSGDGLLDDGLGRNTGILVGGSVQVGVAGRVSLRPELTYVQKGWTTNFRSAQGEKIRTTVALDYLELPVIADVRLVSVREVSVHAVAGPTVGVRVRSEAAGEGGDVSTLSEFGDRIDRTEVGLAAGGGVQGTVGGQVLRLDVRYRWSLLNINDRRVQTPGGLSDSSPFIRNQGGRLRLGSNFSLDSTSGKVCSEEKVRILTQFAHRVPAGR
jgi:opacity protein-like surface antigen